MTKIELVAKAAEKAEVSKKIAEKVINAFLETVEEAVKAGEEVRIVGFGSFQVVKRAERKGINPKTKEEIVIPAKKVVRFKPGKKLELV
jgi:DNA-binding protein HU-beta